MFFMQMTNVEDIDEQIEQIRQKSKLKFLVEPRAITANYFPNDKTIAIYLNTGAVLTIPVNPIQWLIDADPQLLTEIEITPLGDGLHWEKLDIDLSIPGLLSGNLGDAQWMKKLLSETPKI